MRIQPAVRRETFRIAVGTVAMAAAMCIIYACIGKMNGQVALGVLLGCTAAVLNFFLMAMGVQKSAEESEKLRLEETEKPESEDEEKESVNMAVFKPQKQRMQIQYTLRMLMLAGILIAGIKLPCFDGVAVALPLLFPRLVIVALSVIDKKKEGSL